ncbi:hypothetical protein T07_9267 [Trichinella nelsoni]|uniref:Uncharacterized protein n=1 Tax=Trichinella nelsoni TaxID=6336 RepID=A0A0V0RYI7_9BILA|nr:hypothetical protein T07_9267 [Trichinella nelsoni]
MANKLYVMNLKIFFPYYTKRCFLPRLNSSRNADFFLLKCFSSIDCELNIIWISIVHAVLFKE